MLEKLVDLIEKYTSGPIFIIWSVLGIITFVFLFIFQNYYYIDFDKLIYTVSFSAFWFVFSEFFKARKIINKSLSFALDCVFYSIFFGTLFYFTGGMKGNLIYIFFFGAISTPILYSLGQTMFFLSILSVMILTLHFYIGLTIYPDEISNYNTGIIIIALSFNFAVSIIIKIFQRLYKKELKRAISVNEKLEITSKKLEEYSEDLENKVNIRTKELNKKISELERLNAAMMGRELRMVELKKQIKKIKKIGENKL